jgi:hypothetical protein
LEQDLTAHLELFLPQIRLSHFPEKALVPFNGECCFDFLILKAKYIHIVEKNGNKEKYEKEN